MSTSVDSILDAIAERIVVRVTQRILEAVKPHLQTSAVAPRLFTVREAATYMGRTEEAIRHMLKDGKLPFSKLDGRIYLDRRKLDEMIDASMEFAK